MGDSGASPEWQEQVRNDKLKACLKDFTTFNYLKLLPIFKEIKSKKSFHKK